MRKNKRGNRSLRELLIKYSHECVRAFFNLLIYLFFVGFSSVCAVAADFSITAQGEVTASTCRVGFTDGSGNVLQTNILDIEEESVSQLKSGGVLGVESVGLVVNGCYGVTDDANYSKTPSVTVSGTVAGGSPYLFRGGAGTHETNPADPGVGFVVSTKAGDSSKLSPWSTANFVTNNGQVPIGKSTVNLYNSGSISQVVTVPLWIGMSCGDTSMCQAVDEQKGGDLEAFFQFTFSYK